jgi:hypothetical protein
MDISLKHEIADRIIKSDDDVLLNEIKSLIGMSKSDFWVDLPKDVQNEINLSSDEHSIGEHISTHSEVMQEAKNRFLKNKC